MNDYPPLDAKAMATKRKIEQRDGLHCYYTAPQRKDISAVMPREAFEGLEFSMLVYVPTTNPRMRITVTENRPYSSNRHYCELAILDYNNRLQATFKGAPTISTPFHDDAYVAIDVPKQNEYFWAYFKFPGNNITEGYINDKFIGRTEARYNDIISYNALRMIYVWEYDSVEQDIFREFHFTRTSSSNALFLPGSILNPSGAADLYIGGFLTVKGKFQLTDRNAGANIEMKLSGTGHTTSTSTIPAPKWVNIENSSTWKPFEIVFEIRAEHFYYTIDGEPGAFIKKDSSTTRGSIRIQPVKNFEVINVISIDGLRPPSN